MCGATRQAAAAETPDAWAAVLGGLAELCAALGEPLGGGAASTSALGAGGAPDVALFRPGQLVALAAAAPTAGARADVLRIAGALPALPAAAELSDWWRPLRTALYDSVSIQIIAQAFLVVKPMSTKGG